MALCVCDGANLQCSFGSAPATLVVLPDKRVLTSSKPVATISDHKSLLNIFPFGMCNSQSNPQVAAATAAALGVPTPQPCIPVTSTPWAPGSPTVMIGNTTALNNNSRLMCNWAGVIQITHPGQGSTQVP